MIGKLICTNIRQEFVDFNKKDLLDGNGLEIWKAICNGDAIKDPEYFLSRFALLVYADLKKYKYIYWFCFPAINYPKDIYFVPIPTAADLDNKQSSTGETSETSPSPGSSTTVANSSNTCTPILHVMTKDIVALLQQTYESTDVLPYSQKSFFITVVRNLPKDRPITDNDDENNKPLLLFTLAKYEKALELVTNDKSQGIDSNLYFTFADPSSNINFPGWPLRNFICLIAIQFKLCDIKIIRLRRGPAEDLVELQHSTVLHVKYDLDGQFDSLISRHHQDSTEQHEESVVSVCPLITGWEKNESHQLGPRRVSLGHLLDPKQLAEDAVTLNLKLMKWRIVPNLDLDKIAATKCLLLGCGTLGCHVSRMLMAWGIKNITLTDNSKVSFSNPVRQSLYEFTDCLDGGKQKVVASADALKRILPSINSRGFVLNIPMPGHYIPDQLIEQSKKEVAILEGLIDEHDVIFLLMDTRESRWLPTVIGMSKQKLVINAAIGFDTFLLQRHGIREYPGDGSRDQAPRSTQAQDDAAQSGGDVQSGSQQQASLLEERKQNSVASENLGCYFCNDVVVPGDSTSDRTLDQQCTVSRPGVSMMVSGLAVELLISTLSHPMGARAPALTNYDPDDVVDECDLGLVPHSVRGRLSHFQLFTPTTAAFSKCSACSWPVIEAYRRDGYDFLSRVFDDPNYLEEITGLKDLQSVEDDAVWALTSSDEDDACAP